MVGFHLIGKGIGFDKLLAEACRRIHWNWELVAEILTPELFIERERQGA